MAKYLYNGVELPALPEWDKETYPYSLIYTDIMGRTFFVIAISWSTPTATNVYLSCSNALESKLTDGAWGELDEAPFGNVGVERSSLVWTNNDIYMTDGTLYFAASEPILAGNAIIPLAHYKAACDAIRAKTGKTDLIKSGDMATLILSITSGGESSDAVITFSEPSNYESFFINMLGTFYKVSDVVLTEEELMTVKLKYTEESGVEVEFSDVDRLDGYVDLTDAIFPVFKTRADNGIVVDNGGYLHMDAMFVSADDTVASGKGTYVTEGVFRELLREPWVSGTITYKKGA